MTKDNSGRPGSGQQDAPLKSQQSGRESPDIFRMLYDAQYRERHQNPSTRTASSAPTMEAGMRPPLSGMDDTGKPVARATASQNLANPYARPAKPTQDTAVSAGTQLPERNPITRLNTNYVATAAAPSQTGARPVFVGNDGDQKPAATARPVSANATTSASVAPTAETGTTDAAVRARAPIQNPYSKEARAARREELTRQNTPDGPRMLVDETYRKFHQRPEKSGEPPIPYPQSKRAMAAEPSPAQNTTIVGAPQRMQKTFLQDAYFKADNYNLVTAEKHKELIKDSKSKIRPPADLYGHGAALFANADKTKLVSPARLQELDPAFAEKQFRSAAISQGHSVTDSDKLPRQQMLVMHSKKDQLYALQPGQKHGKVGDHQIFLKDQDSPRDGYTDLRVLMAEKRLPRLQDDTRAQLQQITKPETWNQIKQLSADRAAANRAELPPAPAIANAAPAASEVASARFAKRPAAADLPQQEPPKRLRHEMDERTRDRSRI